MEERGYGWLGDPLLHLMLIAVLPACVGIWRSSVKDAEIGPEARLVGTPSVATIPPAADANIAG